MWVGVVTLFPEMLDAIRDSGITRRAIERNLLQLAAWNPRDYATDRHGTVDDKPFGGGPGMLMKVAPLREAIAAAKAAGQAAKGAPPKVIYLSPQGQKLDQAMLAELSTEPGLVTVAGRYEGIDERIIRNDVDLEVSVGDFVVSGGELPAMLLIDGITRLLPGAVGDPVSVETESFTRDRLDYPQFTRPEMVDDEGVPPVLLSGDHEKIRQWRKREALIRTYEQRPDLLERTGPDQEEQAWLDEYLAGHNHPQG